MATVYNKTIFMGMSKPSDKCILVSIPMNMYRIQTNKFTSGLNFFQKAVLKLKYMPQITNSKIANLLHMEEHLVNLITDQLESKGLIASTGYLTPEGEAMRNDANGIVINEKEKQIGYVFSYDNGIDLFPYYQSDICFTELTAQGMMYVAENGNRTIELPTSICSEDLLDGNAPSEDQVVQLIKNSSHLYIGEDIENCQKTDGVFGIKYLPNRTPEKVWVCTYIYLLQSENGEGYDDDWLVQDPFGNGDSYELKLYLEKEKRTNRAFANLLFQSFKDVLTENNRRFDESEQWFNNNVDERIELLLGNDRYAKMDAEVQDAARLVISSYIRMERKDFKQITKANKQLFFLNMQETLEFILKHDQIEREDIYADLNNNMGNYASVEDRQDCLKQVYRKKLLAETTFVPHVLLTKKVKNWTGKSLLDYLMKFIMSLAFESDLRGCAMISVFKNRIDDVIGIADMRNHVAHSSTGNHRRNDNFDKEDAVDYFNLIVEIINDYIKTL